MGIEPRRIASPSITDRLLKKSSFIKIKQKNKPSWGRTVSLSVRLQCRLCQVSSVSIPTRTKSFCRADPLFHVVKFNFLHRLFMKSQKSNRRRSLALCHQAFCKCPIFSDGRELLCSMHRRCHIWYLDFIDILSLLFAGGCWGWKWGQVRAGWVEGASSHTMPVRSGANRPLATRPNASHSHFQQMVQFLLISPYNITKRGFFLGSLCLYLEKFVILMPNWESWARRVRDTTADGRPFLLCFRFIFLIFSSRCLAF